MELLDISAHLSDPAGYAVCASASQSSISQDFNQTTMGKLALNKYFLLINQIQGCYVSEPYSVLK